MAGSPTRWGNSSLMATWRSSTRSQREDDEPHRPAAEAPLELVAVREDHPGLEPGAGCAHLDSDRSVYRRSVRGGGWRDGDPRGGRRRREGRGDRDSARRPAHAPPPCGEGSGVTGRARIAVAAAVAVAFLAAFGIAYVAGSGSEAEGEPAGTVTARPDRLREARCPTARPRRSRGCGRCRRSTACAAPPPASTTREPSSPPDQGGTPAAPDSLADARPRRPHPIRASRRVAPSPVARAFQATRKGVPAPSPSVSVGLRSIPERGGEP